jgi:biopolymer transport protein TolR
MAMGPSSRPGALSEINVTPMVDVMLVLLIIFMVTAPLITQGVAVQLPQTRAQALDVHNRPMVLTLTKDHRIFLNETPIKLAELRDKLTGNINLRDGKQVDLHADRDLDYGFVVDVMALLKDAGVDNLGLVTDPAGASPRVRKR